MEGNITDSSQGATADRVLVNVGTEQAHEGPTNLASEVSRAMTSGK